MTLREFKFVIQPILLMVEDDKVVGEKPAEPIILYGIDRVQEFIDKFPQELDNLNKE